MANLHGNARAGATVIAARAYEARRQGDPLDEKLACRLNEQTSTAEREAAALTAHALKELAAWMVGAIALCGLCLALFV